MEELLFLKEEDESISRGLAQEKPISQAPSNVYVITDEDIRHSGATDLPTVLRRVPGMEVMQMTGADFNVSVRGDNQLPSNKLLVLIDGRSVYEDAYGSVFWTTLPVTLPEIKRIEVLKGPASALYGFNAVDGVINIITKSPDEIKGTILQFGGGELGTIRAAAIHAGTHDKFGYRLSVGRDQNQQWRNRDALALRQDKVNLHTDYALSPDSKLIFQSGFLSNNRFDGQIYETISETTTGITSGFVNLTYQRRNFFVRGWWTYWRDESDETIVPSISRFFRITDSTGSVFQERARNTYNVDAQHTLEIGSSHRVTYGVNARHNRFTTHYLFSNGAREERLGFYLQEEWRASDKITAIAGLRYDLHSEINATYSPRVALLYSPAPDHTIRLSGSVAYRPPTMYESFINSRGTVFPLGCPPVCGVAVGTSLLGSRNLKPEQLISYELGYQGWFLKHRLRARVDLFYNQISDLIAFQAPTPANKIEATIYGGEAGLEYLVTSWLTGFVNYSYQEIEQHPFGNTAATTSTAQRGAPRFKTNAGLRGEWENGWSGEALVHYYGAATYPINPFFSAAAGFPGGQPAPNSRVGSYVLLNLRGAYRFWQEKQSGREAEMAFTAFNALNDKHKENPLGDEIGSRVMGWLTIKY
jgi:iron complex outermembrane receptor protein